MPKDRISTLCNNGCYFITPTIWNWYYIFDRHNRWQILADSIKYCQEHKNLEVYSYVFMLNHIHMIVKSPDVSGFLRDFKQFTSRMMIKNIAENEPNVLELFKIGDNNYRFWKDDNKPKLIEDKKFAMQKVNYIHNNPVKKGYVLAPEHWAWSSANPYSQIKIEPIW